MDIMTDEEKAAVLLLSLKEDVAVNVVKHLAPDEVKRVGMCMKGLTRISNEEIEYVSKEFCSVAQGKGSQILSVHSDFVETVIMEALGETKAREFMKALEDDSYSSDSPIIARLREADPSMLMDFTKREHPQTIALMLAHLKPEQAAEILENLSSENQEDIAERIATLDSVSREFMGEMTKALESEIVVEGDTGEHIGGVKMMAEILNRMSRASEKVILTSLEKASPDLTNEIKNFMFSFDDIFKLDNRSIRLLLEEVDREDLALALKIGDDEMKEKVFKNMSKRAAEMLREDISVLPPTRLSVVEKSQKAIVDVAKKLEAEDKITMATGHEEDVLV